jgi:hypothetical protein
MFSDSSLLWQPSLSRWSLLCLLSPWTTKLVENCQFWNLSTFWYQHICHYILIGSHQTKRVVQVPCYFFHGLKLHPQGEKNIQQANEQMCLCLWRISGGWFGTNASLLTLGSMFTGSRGRWWNIHLGPAQNFSNNPVFMSAQGSRRIQPNLNWNNAAIA